VFPSSASFQNQFDLRGKCFAVRKDQSRGDPLLIVARFSVKLAFSYRATPKRQKAPERCAVARVEMILFVARIAKCTTRKTGI
jgi:hypothetical protein